MNTDVFILARLGSSRLPEKHLKLVNGKPAIKQLIDRLKSAKKIRNIVVCTTTHALDDKLVQLLQKESIAFFRGSEKDVLARFLDAAKQFKTDVIIDVEGDKIYSDPFYVDKIITTMEENNVDFVIGSNSTEFDPTDHFTHGIIPAGVRVHALEKLCLLKKSSDTETGYKEFFISSNIFSKKYIKPEIIPKNIKKIRLTLDYQEDLELANLIFKELGSNFGLRELVKLLDQKPSLIKMTETIITKWETNYKNRISDLSLEESR
ncbi:MAG: acylneuraminate cytidylyltransferase [Nitrososphaerota archaeon]